MRTDVLNRIKETLRKVVPAGGHAFLYGSQARDEARPDSDWDILILLDKLKIEVEDYDNVSYPLVELGWSLNECVSPVLYTLKDWMRYHFSPLYTT
ncbi:nucleotidyltransferase domain-containing protein [Parabacteroides distasonis]|nr:nucleotidyltransferase domain-containing protein [Parabacteroides distasonis]